MKRWGHRAQWAQIKKADYYPVALHDGKNWREIGLKKIAERDLP